MAALALWVRRTWIRRWVGLLGLGLLIALVGGVTLAVAAGARRTASAFGRLQATTHAPPVQVELAPVENPTEAMYADLPTPAVLADQIEHVTGVKGVAVASFMGATPDPAGSYFSIIMAASRGAAPRDRLVAGRLPDPREPSEVIVNEAAVEAWHTGVGRTLRLHTLGRDQMATFMGLVHEQPHGPVIDTTVVGVVRGVEDISDVPEPAFGAGPAFLERWGPDVAQVTAAAQINTDRSEADAVIARLNPRLDDRFVATRTADRDDFASRVAETIDVDVTVLTVFAVAAGLAGLLVVGQALARTVGGQEPEQERLGALGMTRPEATLALVAALGPALVLGALGAVALAIALSPVFPRGLARRAEPALGVDLDTVVLLGGAVTVLLVVLTVAAVVSWRAATASAARGRQARPSSARVSTRAVRALPPAALLGTTFALDGGHRRRTAGGLAGVVGAAVLVGGVVGVATVQASSRTLLTTSRLYGASWDYELDLSDGPQPDVVAALASDPDVAAMGTRAQLLANGGDLQVRGPKGSALVGPMAYTAVKGTVPPVISDGRPPGAGEAAIGRRLARRLGIGLGDRVVVEGYRSDVPLQVTGWFVDPGNDDLDLGVLVARDTLDAFTATACPTSTGDASCTVTDEGAGIVLRHGASPGEAAQRLTALAPDLVAVSPPSVVDNLSEIGNTPWLLAGFLVLIGGAGLAHALIVGVRSRRRDLAVVRAIGLRPGQARRVVTWQAFLVAAAGSVLGLLIGLLVGRLVWDRVATGIGAIVRVDVPLAALVLAPALAVGLGIALSLLTGRRASGLRPAIVLRAE